MARRIDADAHLEEVVEHRGDGGDQLRLPDQLLAALRAAGAAREIELLVVPALEQALRALRAAAACVLGVAVGDQLPLALDQLRERSHRVPARDVDLLLEQLERAGRKACRELLAADPPAPEQVAQRGHRPDHDAALGARSGHAGDIGEIAGRLEPVSQACLAK
jgi:hypothetical protein